MPRQAPQIDVFIPVYNDIDFLPHAVDSVLSQEGVTLGLVISDNASTDGTSAWLDRLAERDPRVRVHRNATNIGALANCRRFFELAEAEFSMFLCSDDRLAAPDALASALAVMHREPDVVGVYCDLRYIDGAGHTLAKRRFDRSGRYDARAVLRQTLLSGRNLYGIPLLHRTAVMKRYPFPEGSSYSCDVYLSAKTGEEGQLYHLPRILIENRYTGRNVTADVAWQTRAQFDRLAETCGVRLSRTERLVQRFRIALTLLQKALFLRYARWRSSRA